MGRGQPHHRAGGRWVSVGVTSEVATLREFHFPPFPPQKTPPEPSGLIPGGDTRPSRGSLSPQGAGKGPQPLLGTGKAPRVRLGEGFREEPRRAGMGAGIFTSLRPAQMEPSWAGRALPGLGLSRDGSQTGTGPLWRQGRSSGTAGHELGVPSEGGGGGGGGEGGGGGGIYPRAPGKHLDLPLAAAN